MKNLACIVLIASVAAGAWAQNPVTSFSHYGNTSESATSTKYVYTRGGSPRTGFYHYWRATQVEGISKTTPIPAPGTTGWQAATGVYFSPSYTAKTLATTSVSSTATETTYSALLEAMTVFNPILGSHQAAAVSSGGYDYATFTIDTPSLVTIKPKGNGGSIQLIDLASNEAIFSSSGTGSFADTIDAGSYEVVLRVNMESSNNTQTGAISNLGGYKTILGYTITFAAG